MTDPKPLLLDDAIVSDELRSVLDARSAHEPSASDLSRLRDRLAAALPPGTLPPSAAPGQPPPAPPAAAPPAPLLSSGAAKIAIGVALAGAIGGAIWLARDGGTSADPSPPAPAATSAAPAVSSPPLLPLPVTSIEAPPLVTATASMSARRPSASAPLRSSADTDALPPPEAALLSRAHDELLRGAPDKALATTAEHERAHPRGALAQEREVIAIEALVALGRRDEARRRAASFHRVYPGSSHGDRIDRLVGQP